MLLFIHWGRSDNTTNSLLTTYDVNTTVCGLIAQEGMEHPDRKAIIDGKINIDYQTLLKRASEVAGELQHRGVVPGSLVGVCMHRSWELVAALLGVMQAGCAYVPLDPAYPQDRVRYMLEHSRAVAAIVDQDSTPALCADVGEQVRMASVGAHADTTVRPSATDLAYVIYTSGSTGKPKGVAVEHRNVMGVHHEMRARFSDQELQGIFAGASVCFDTSVMEIFGTLSLGGTIILGNNGLDLTRLPATHQIRTAVMVASAVQAMLATERLPEQLRTLVFGGEALKRSLVAQVHAQKPALRVLNAYGPTEDTVYSTMAELPNGTESVTIGTSVPGSRAYILDEALQPVADGEPGELHLAGSKLARGYLYEPELTLERFIARAATKAIPDTRLYKTGDLVRRAANGEIEFLGRVDQQVKVRGYRIELGEIESTLEGMEGVDAAAAAAVEGSIGQKMLVVYVVSSDEAVTDEAVKAYLAQRLPKYMVPQVVKYLDALPLLPNDKLDRKQLMRWEEESRQAQEASILLSGGSQSQEASTLSAIQQEVAAL
ncbi:MAG TPA: hypothetical protein DCR93_12390, partial [Cytophagales bacterium]|nr:hypothetical protein [Cytophagales bacterium]